MLVLVHGSGHRWLSRYTQSLFVLVLIVIHNKENKRVKNKDWKKTMVKYFLALVNMPLKYILTQQRRSHTNTASFCIHIQPRGRESGASRGDRESVAIGALRYGMGPWDEGQAHVHARPTHINSNSGKEKKKWIKYIHEMITIAQRDHLRSLIR